MFSRRIALAMLGAVLILTAGVMPASAARPTRTAPAAERRPPRERPLTAEEQAASDRKVAAAMPYLASPEAQVVRPRDARLRHAGGRAAGRRHAAGRLDASAIPRPTPTAMSRTDSCRSRRETRSAGITAGPPSAR